MEDLVHAENTVLYINVALGTALFYDSSECLE